VQKVNEVNFFAKGQRKEKLTWATRGLYVIYMQYVINTHNKFHVK
jgi:hypothetical protein